MRPTRPHPPGGRADELPNEGYVDALAKLVHC